MIGVYAYSPLALNEHTFIFLVVVLLVLGCLFILPLMLGLGGFGGQQALPVSIQLLSVLPCRGGAQYTAIRFRDERHCLTTSSFS